MRLKKKVRKDYQPTGIEARLFFLSSFDFITTPYMMSS